MLLLAAGSVAAQDAEGDPQTEEARALFAEGVDLADQERFEEAAERFHRAYQLRPAAPIALNLGNALIESGRLVEGTEMLRQVTRDTDASEELRERAEWSIENAELRIGSIVVHLTGPLDDVVVEVAGSPLAPGSYGVPVSADPGPNEVSARRGPEIVASSTVDVQEGGQAELTLEIPVSSDEVAILPVEAEPVVDEGEDGGILGKWWFWTAVGVVVVAAVITAVVISTSGSNTEGSLGSGMLQ